MWREGYVPGGDTRFWVRALGHADDVVMLLHGWPEDGGTWDRVAPLLADAGYRVVAPDLKGFGRTEAPEDTSYDPETLADEIAQLIRNLHAQKVVLVGHDWGGAVALATAFRHPGRVRSLVVASSPYRQLDLRRAWHIPLMNVPIVAELAFRFAARPLVKGALTYASRVREPFDAERVDRYAASVAGDPSAWLAYYRTMSRQAVLDWTVGRIRKRLSSAPVVRNRLRVPALVIWGSDDPVLPIGLGARVAHDLGAELVTVEGAGHFVPEEDPLAFARAIVAFAGAAEGSSRLAGRA